MQFQLGHRSIAVLAVIVVVSHRGVKWVMAPGFEFSEVRALLT